MRKTRVAMVTVALLSPLAGHAQDGWAAVENVAKAMGATTVNSHFDRAGGLRAVAAEGAPIITHEINRASFERALAAPATVTPDCLARSGRKGR